ncbi:MAG TPA: asparagine synthase (glutamine-hydrolyzing), partial [Chroococcidiopsis sp.]
MCGILTFLSWNDEVSESAFRRGLERLEHRGPDGKGAWISPHRRVALGHTRLSIIDLNTGEQPIANLDGSLRIVANGEFYDFERVRQRLQEWGYTFKTQSDTEIALHLYDQFGPECLRYLRGEFAFVIWDDRQQLMFAARDRFGIKPLYYTVYQDTLYLASEIKALLAAGIPAVWDQETFLAVNARALHPERTLVAGVQQVPPGHFLIASHGTVKLQRYWDFDYAIAPDAESASPPPPTLQDYAAQVSATLDDAIRLRLRSDVPIACYLSGGLDSSAILGIANQHASSPLPAFSLAFSHDDYNEIAIAQETAKHLGSELHVLPIQDADL